MAKLERIWARRIVKYINFFIEMNSHKKFNKEMPDYRGTGILWFMHSTSGI